MDGGFIEPKSATTPPHPIHRLLRSRPSRAVAAIRIACGLIFVAFSTGKFRRHDAEAGAFDRYGIPWPDTTVYLVGALELVGGLLLVAGLLTRPAAAALAVNMAVATATAGHIDPSLVHTGLAPVLLVATAALAFRGGGSWSLDRRLAGGPP